MIRVVKTTAGGEGGRAVGLEESMNRRFLISRRRPTTMKPRRRPQLNRSLWRDSMLSPDELYGRSKYLHSQFEKVAEEQAEGEKKE